MDILIRALHAPMVPLQAPPIDLFHWSLAVVPIVGICSDPDRGGLVGPDGIPEPEGMLTVETPAVLVQTATEP